MSGKYRLFTVVTLVFLVLDQVTKIWVVRNLEYQRDEIQIIDGWFSLVHAQNKGAAFGFMSNNDNAMVFFAVFTLIAVGVLGQMLREMESNETLQIWGVSLVASGALGNAIDRAHKQSVTDFLRVYTEHPSLQPWLIENFRTYEWPSFNVADAAIVVGLGLFMVDYLFFQKEEEELPSDPPEKMLDEE